MSNEIALRKHQDKLAKKETARNRFLEDIDDKLMELKAIAKEINNIASDYDGYDFSDDVEDIIRDSM